MREDLKSLSRAWCGVLIVLVFMCLWAPFVFAGFVYEFVIKFGFVAGQGLSEMALEGIDSLFDKPGILGGKGK